MELKLFTISNDYLEFLKNNPELHNVFDNKDSQGSHKRKYIGVVFNIGEYRYYAPLSSPKNTDYIWIDGRKEIRRTIVPIIRIIVENELKGTIKLSNMIPVPSSELTYYNIELEQDENYKILVQKEYDFIKRNEKMILKNANILYRQKTDSTSMNRYKPAYLNATIDFRYAENRCDRFIKEMVNFRGMF